MSVCVSLFRFWDSFEVSSLDTVEPQSLFVSLVA